MNRQDAFYDEFVGKVADAYHPLLADQWAGNAADTREFALSLPVRTHGRKEAMFEARKWRMRANRLRAELAGRKANA